VSHSASKQGAGEVSSANYEARAFGIRAVMVIGEARKLCPNLVVMPYEFDKYEDISDKVAFSPLLLLSQLTGTCIGLILCTCVHNWYGLSPIRQL